MFATAIAPLKVKPAIGTHWPKHRGGKASHPKLAGLREPKEGSNRLQRNANESDCVQ
jgi:hypothetical protein